MLDVIPTNSKNTLYGAAALILVAIAYKIVDANEIEAEATVEGCFSFKIKTKQNKTNSSYE